MSHDRGVTSVQFLLASALALVLFVAMANVVVVHYGRAAIRSALEQGVRAGSLDGDGVVCSEKIAEVLSQLLAGRMSDDLEVSCATSGDVMAATATAVFRSWTPLSPDFVVEVNSRALIEAPP